MLDGKLTEAFRLNIHLRFHLDRDNVRSLLQQEVDLLRAVGLGIIEQLMTADELLQRILLGQSAFKFCENKIPLDKRTRVKTCHSAQQANVYAEHLECASILIALQRKSCGLDRIDSVDQSSVNQPLECQLIFTCPRSLLDQSINEFTVLLAQLRRYGEPKISDARSDLHRCMFREISLVTLQNLLLDLSHL